MMKPILAVLAALSFAVGGVSIADKGPDQGRCPGDCVVDCPGDCGKCPGKCRECPGKCGPRCPGECDVDCPGDCGKCPECPVKCGPKCPGDCGFDCPDDCTPRDCKSRNGRKCQQKSQCPAKMLHGGCGGPKGVCGNSQPKPNATKKD